jgi:prolyl-tRNA synthetase
MFADWELIGVPHRVTIGDKGLKDGLVEYQHRGDTEASKVAVAEVLGLLRSKLSN